MLKRKMCPFGAGLDRKLGSSQKKKKKTVKVPPASFDKTDTLSTIESLPAEIVQQILLFLAPADFLALKSTSKTMKTLTKKASEKDLVDI